MGYSMSKKRCCEQGNRLLLGTDKGRVNINYKKGKEILPNKRLNPYFMLVRLS
jgi:hypothetical protein